ncbi:polysaccharide deacetylase family protein [Flaviaesturariibacter flavus]|uniref:Polysaccharide deacetylase family protein n=1 Tax=Flaviaesturariibacter flavus TaxID=2502780 RepID=A0A4R1BP77_9BACT|nr:polysaccharide deacetylase family protein [Flaviaesturariibacter flavus]TCJ19117.1 polysaccharide deacetylase family protein [Flaviaesturariibacter flavus]
MTRSLSLALLLAAGLAACNGTDAGKNAADSTRTTAVRDTATGTKPVVVATDRPIADAATIMARKQVPVLCYHHIYDVPKATREYDVTANEFRNQLKMLHDSGYHSVLPDQLYNYLAFGDPLPDKPFMLTFDDTDEEQFSIAKPAMDKYGFKGVYFIMTISIGRPRYMTKEQIRQLADEGHAVESHTWRHDRVDKYLTTPHIDKGTGKMVENDWDLQLGVQRKKLEDISGKPIHYFAYPFGIWSKEGIPELKKRDIRMAFQLSTKRDSLEPLHTVRRIIVPPTWSAEGLLKVMRTSFDGRR